MTPSKKPIQFPSDDDLEPSDPLSAPGTLDSDEIEDPLDDAAIELPDISQDEESQRIVNPE